MITCPKCGSENNYSARDEAPAWAKVWMKCFACGKRWDHAGAAPPSDDEGEARADVPKKRSGQDIVALVMDLSRSGKAVSNKEKKTMARCSKGKCQMEAAEDSVRCARHRDEQRVSNAKYNGRADPGKSTRKYVRRAQPDDFAAVAAMHTKRTAPITLAEPTMLNPPSRSLDLNGNVSALLDSCIGRLQGDLQTLLAAKEVMERHG